MKVRELLRAEMSVPLIDLPVGECLID